MPTAILDLEFNDLPPLVSGLEAYSEAQVLVRVAAQPAAWVRVPVENGCMKAQAVVDALHKQATHAFWQLVAQHHLAPLLPAVRHEENLPRATIAICTRDRADDLARCLASLRCLPADGQEILVVDSASRTDATSAVVAEFPEVRSVRLDRPGLNVARNAAMQFAAGEIVIFIDDDAVADANWLRAHLQAFDNPLTMASMGLTLPLELESEAQEQFERFSTFSRGFTPLVYDRHNTHPLAAGRAGSGVNMAIRRQVTAQIGLFDDALDSGTPTHSGGESEFLSRIIAHGFRIVYTPAALNWHRHRRTMAELRRTIYGYGVGVYAFWTCRLLRGGETAVPIVAAQWFWYAQLPRLLRSLVRRPGAAPWPLPWDELRGCWAGPWAYMRSRRQAEKVRA